LDDSIKAVEKKVVRVDEQAPITFQKKPEQVQEAPAAKRFKVMVGAADRMENLWPRNLL